MYLVKAESVNNIHLYTTENICEPDAPQQRLWYIMTMSYKKTPS